MDKNQKRDVSKTMSYVLRHNPTEFGLCLDDRGYVNINEFLQALLKHDRRCRVLGITLRDIEEIVEEDTKQRYEIQEGNIRAFYGHSTEKIIKKVPIVPPKFLYHGTNLEGHNSIVIDRLIKSMGRQYVHLSQDIETATIVAKRKPGKTIILKIDALQAYKDGIEFFKEKNGIFLSKPIPLKYVIREIIA